MIRLKSIIILVSFIAIIAFSNSGYLFEVESIENLENRNMAKCPKLILSNLDPFPREFEKYYVDNFNFRQTLLEWNKYLKVNVFKESPHKSVIIGSDGFLFAEKYINTYTHQRIFSENEIFILLGNQIQDLMSCNAPTDIFFKGSILPRSTTAEKSVA